MKIYPFIDSFYRKATVKDGYNTRLLKLYHAFKEAEHVVIGAGAGFSAAAGLEYGGKRFTDNFQDFIARYNTRVRDKDFRLFNKQCKPHPCCLPHVETQNFASRGSQVP